MKKKALLILAGCLLLFGTSCYYDSIVEYEDDNGGELPPPGENISFEEKILPIIEVYNCAGCHGGGRAPDLRSENAYNSLLNGFVEPFEPENSVFFQRVPGKDHPQPPTYSLTASEIDLIEAWIDRGALE